LALEVLGRELVAQALQTVQVGHVGVVCFLKERRVCGVLVGCADAWFQVINCGVLLNMSALLSTVFFITALNGMFD
jgi:hypothetical protein